MSDHLITSNTSKIDDCYPPDTAQIGQVWYDSAIQTMVVYTIEGWRPHHQPTVIMTYDAEQAIDWSIDKMSQKSPQLTDMIAKYPLVADAVDQLEVALKLCQNLDSDVQT